MHKQMNVLQLLLLGNAHAVRALISSNGAPQRDATQRINIVWFGSVLFAGSRTRAHRWAAVQVSVVWQELCPEGRPQNPFGTMLPIPQRQEPQSRRCRQWRYSCLFLKINTLRKRSVTGKWSSWIQNSINDLGSNEGLPENETDREQKKKRLEKLLPKLFSQFFLKDFFPVLGAETKNFPDLIQIDIVAVFLSSGNF